MTVSVPGLPELLRDFYGETLLGQVLALPGQASTRRYYRFSVDDAGTLAPGLPAALLVMQLPREGEHAAPALEQARSFIELQAFLRARGVPVPSIHRADLSAGLILLEDLGDETFEGRLRTLPAAQWPQCYAQAIDLLVDLHIACEPGGVPSACVAYGRRFDQKLLRWELDHFRQWGLEALYGELPVAQRVQLDSAFDTLTQTLLALPQGFAHRDYQSRNLMWAPGERLTVIDFQDALLGPQAYDLVALLCDSYVELAAPLQNAMLAHYASRRGFSAAQSAQLVRGFHLVAVQRKLKDAGRFVFIDRVRHNPAFLHHYPQSLRYVGRALAALPELRSLRELLVQTVPGFPDAAGVPASAA